MAKANPSLKDESQEPKSAKPEQIVKYFGKGAEDVKFPPQPDAREIHVYSNGNVLVYN